MGIIKKLFTRRLTEEEKEARSIREKEWAEKCYTKGEEFAQRIALHKGVARINAFANRYPRTFFAILLGFVGVSIVLNFFLSSPSSAIMDSVRNLEDIPAAVADTDPRSEIISEMVQMSDNLKDLDKRIEVYLQKDTLTRQDSLDLKSLLMQADALSALLNGRQQLVKNDSANINKLNE